MKIKIKYLRDIEKIGKIPIGDWVDLRASKNLYIPKNMFAMVPLGIAMQLPKGYEAHVVPRGSTFKNFGIIQTNHMGIIDESYCGDNDEWFFPAYALRDTFIPINSRICQFRIVKKMTDIAFVEVDILGNKNRGGYGTTGRI